MPDMTELCEHEIGNSAELESVLANIRGKFAVRFEPLDVDGEILKILTIDNMPEHLAQLARKKAIKEPLRDLPLWAKVWPASFVLGRFLRTLQPEGKTILELGAGMGICSLVAARYGFSQIVCSDIADDALAFAQANILRNNLAHLISPKKIDVAQPNLNLSCEYDFIVASELLYLDDLHRPLLKFLQRNLATNGKAIFAIDLARMKPHFKKLAIKDFSVQEGHIRLQSTDADNVKQRRVYTILILER